MVTNQASNNIRPVKKGKSDTMFFIMSGVVLIALVAGLYYYLSIVFGI